jgi:hypothetical protein
MLHVDVPTLPEIRALITERADACVSIYLATTPQTQHVGSSQIEFGNLSTEASRQLSAIGFDKRRLAMIEEELADLRGDDEFWRLQANSLAVLATADRIRTFRMATAVTSTVEVSDRFLLKPLLRAIVFPQHAFVLALSENSVRLIEVFAEQAPMPIKVPDLPRSAADAVGRASVNNLTQGTRIANSQGQNVLLKQYVRQVDACLRPVLAGRDTPLILAATEPLASLYRAASSYPALAAQGIVESPDRLKDHELAQAARTILDRVYADAVDAAKALFRTRLGQRRATTDLGEIAHAATHGAIEHLAFDLDTTLPGTVDDDTGTITLAASPSALTYDVIDEIVDRAILSGARYLGVRKDDIPEGAAMAATLRYPM